MGGTHPFTVVVRCADPRLEDYFTDESLRRSMGLSPGRETLGEAHIANAGSLLPFMGVGASRLVHDAALLIRLFAKDQRGRVVLTAHSSCGGYNTAVDGDAAAIRLRQEDDLLTIADHLTTEISDADVACYYIDLETGEVGPVLI